MRTKLLSMIAALAALAGVCAWGEGNERRDAALTEAQKKQVAEILSKYKSDALTAEQITAIRAAFKEARLPGGRVLDDAIESAGFDSKALRPPKKDDKDAKGGDDKSTAGGDKDAKKSKAGGTQFNIEQATSDRAQLHTLAYDGMAWLSGSFYCDTFLPPGKVSDFFGFQYLRDNDKAAMGHNTAFLTRIANNMMRLLTKEQKAKLIALGTEQKEGIREYAIRRFPMMKAFRRVLDGDVPKGTSLSKEAVEKYSADLYQLDGELFIRRAEVMAAVLRSFSAEQQATIKSLAAGNWKTWPDAAETDDKRSMNHDVHVLVMTYVSEMFSWYAGSVEADTYFCPEGIAKYFGAFYVKDAPAVRVDNYSIGMELTGEGGADFIRMLSDEQKPYITNLVYLQRPYLQKIVTTRRSIATELRKLMDGKEIDKKMLINLSRTYGELDGAISYYYATGFSAAGRSLTTEQRAKLPKLRNLDAKFTPTKPFAYADPIDMPDIPDTGIFFK